MTEYHFDELDETGKVVDTITRSGPATVGRQSKDSTSDIQIPA